MEGKMYKECEDCEEPISEGRLRAFARRKETVSTCISCQEDREASGRFKTHRMDIQAVTRCGGEVEELQQTIVRG